jgi:hypothetical protein
VLKLSGKSLLLLFVCSGCTSPANYDECVLHKMQGQADAMLGHVRELCETQFPFEKELPGYEANIDVEWWSDSDSLTVRIKKNFGNYRVTRYKASFAPGKCENVVPGLERFGIDPYHLTKTFEFSGGSSKATVSISAETNTYGCMRTDAIYGVKAK